MAAHHIKLEVYEDEAHEYRWRMLRSGNIVADSAEGYSKRSAARRAATRLVSAIVSTEAAVGVQIVAGT